MHQNLEKYLTSDRFAGRASINPYRDLSLSYPGRIFCFDRSAGDRALLTRVQSSSAPQILEFGSGSGNHLLQLAERSPDAQCYGFELRYKRAVRTIQKADKEGRDNVFVLLTDARSAGEYFAQGSVSQIYVNFPDPWSKLKRRKHRLLTENLLGLAASLLTADGTLAVKTDHREYFFSFLEVAKNFNGFKIAEQSEDLHSTKKPEEIIRSEFEELFCSQGLPIYYVQIRRS